MKAVVFDLDETLAATGTLPPGRRVPADVLELSPPGAAAGLLAVSEEVRRLPARLIKAGATVGIATRAPRAYALTLLDLLDVDFHYLAASDVSDGVEGRLEHTLGMLRVEPEDAVYVGDRRRDRDAAWAVGSAFMRAWTSPEAQVERLLEGAEPFAQLPRRVPFTVHPQGTPLRRWQVAARRARPLSEGDLDWLEDRVDQPDRGAIAWTVLRSSPGQPHRRRLQRWALRGLTSSAMQCFVVQRIDQGQVLLSPNVILRDEYLRPGPSRMQAMAAAASLFPRRSVTVGPAGTPTFALMPFHHDLGGELLRKGKSWVNDGGKGRSGHQVITRLLELPALALAGNLGEGPEPIVPVASSDFRRNQPGEASLRLAHRVAELTGRRLVDVLEKHERGVQRVQGRIARGSVILLDDQITAGDSIRSAHAALEGAGVTVAEVWAWSASNRAFQVRPRSGAPDSCELSAAADLLGVNNWCFAHTHGPEGGDSLRWLLR